MLFRVAPVTVTVDPPVTLLPRGDAVIVTGPATATAETTPAALTVATAGLEEVHDTTGADRVMVVASLYVAVAVSRWVVPSGSFLVAGATMTCVTVESFTRIAAVPTTGALDAAVDDAWIV